MHVNETNGSQLYSIIALNIYD